MLGTPGFHRGGDFFFQGDVPSAILATSLVQDAVGAVVDLVELVIALVLQEGLSAEIESQGLIAHAPNAEHAEREGCVFFFLFSFWGITSIGR